MLVFGTVTCFIATWASECAHVLTANESACFSSYNWFSKPGVWLNIPMYTSAFKHLYFCYLSLSIPPSQCCIFSFLWVLYLLVPLLGCPPPPHSEVEGDRALLGYKAPWRGERDRGRRPRQYICPGESRKTSERFRTQPITSAERQETDRYLLWIQECMTESDECWEISTWSCMSKKS